MNINSGKDKNENCPNGQQCCNGNPYRNAQAHMKPIFEQQRPDMMKMIFILDGNAILTLMKGITAYGRFVGDTGGEVPVMVVLVLGD
jgi:hypothetical protein